jgi:Na+-driven multidrug efflux pump
MTISLISLGCFRIPLAGIFSHSPLGLTGIWIAAFISFGMNALLGFLYYKSGKWLPHRKPSPVPEATIIPDRA